MEPRTPVTAITTILNGGKTESIDGDVHMPVWDFITQVQIGNVSGYELRAIAGENSNVGPTFVDLTPTGGTQATPTAAENWEIVSTDANDATAGTGARTVAVKSLDDNYVEQTTSVTLNGLTPVAIANTHFRTDTAIVLTAGSDASNTNIGDLIIRVAGGGTERMKIPAGVGDCKSLRFTIPAGKTGFGRNIVVFCAKNEDCVIKPLVTPLSGATSIGATFSTYQNGQSIPITSPIVIPEKTDICVIANSTNPASNVLAFFAFLLVDNDKLLNP